VTVTKVAGKKVGNYIAKKFATNALGGVLGRFVPLVGWGLFAYDVYDFRAEIKQWAEELQQSNEENKTNADGTWNAAWGASACFIDGTLIKTKNGYIPIENIKIGDSVYSFDTETNTIGLSIVNNNLKKEVTEFYEITTEKEKIIVTSEHPFFVVNKGWIKVKDLKISDLLKSSILGFSLKILNIEMLTGKINVYNIEVSGHHNYFITKSEILVHNKDISKYFIIDKK